MLRLVEAETKWGWNTCSLHNQFHECTTVDCSPTHEKLIRDSRPHHSYTHALVKNCRCQMSIQSEGRRRGAYTQYLPRWCSVTTCTVAMTNHSTHMQPRWTEPFADTGDLNPRFLWYTRRGFECHPTCRSVLTAVCWRGCCDKLEKCRNRSADPERPAHTQC